MNHFKEYLKLWFKLDAMSEEELDSPEADSIRDEGDPHWYAMSEEDKEFFRKIMGKIG